jgi:hypothetical protein
LLAAFRSGCHAREIEGGVRVRLPPPVAFRRGIVNNLGNPKLSSSRAFSRNEPESEVDRPVRRPTRDPGYLSRILRGFARRRLITRMRSPTDGRQQLLRLTRKGQTIFAPLDSRAREDVAALLDPLSDAEQRRLIDAMRAIERLLRP